jgi:hypothetical protein
MARASLCFAGPCLPYGLGVRCRRRPVRHSRHLPLLVSVQDESFTFLKPLHTYQRGGWVWVPSLLLLSRQDSIAAVFAGTMGAAIMATGLRKVVVSDPGAPRRNSGWNAEELFAQSLYVPPRDRHALFISVCIYSGFFALRGHRIFVASILLALCTFLLAWKLTLASDPTPSNQGTAALRLLRVGSAAVAFTFAVVLLGFNTAYIRTRPVSPLLAAVVPP